ncbi:MAG: fibronectin type III domain-containing protein [Deltaproteobacteria bacterium]|nr:fibronectin type III domain-containing protein [Deltaproteobacteria bacterium]MBW2341561.1 fibronectin type III domain-containing protein [Deltaproteobacteria bacterium]
MIFSYNRGRCNRGYAATFFLLKLGLVVLCFTLFLTVSASAAKISLTWDASSTPADGYRVFCREQGENYDYTLPVWEGSALTCTIYDLDEYGTYYFVVRAYNDSGESGNSNEACSAKSSISVGTGTEGGGCFIVSAGQGPKDRWIDRSKDFRRCPFEDVNWNKLYQALLH